MPIIMPEVILESVLRESFTELRDNINVLDEWLSIYSEPYLKSVYGQVSIDNVKKNILENEIPILMSWHEIPSKIPCITISTISTDEAQDKAMLGDYGYTLDSSSPPAVLLNNVLLVSYDSLTGWLVLDPSTNISTLSAGQIVIDARDFQYAISAVLTTQSGAKQVNIGINQVSPVGPVKIVEDLDFTRSRHLTVPVSHRLLLSIHTKDAFLTKNLHYLLLYFLLSNKTKMTKRDLLLTTWSSSDFSRDISKLPELVYTRSIDLYAITFFSWVEANDALASSMGDKVYVPKDIYDRLDGDIFTVDTEKD